MLSALEETTTAAALLAMPPQERMEALEQLTVRRVPRVLQAGDYQAPAVPCSPPLRESGPAEYSR